MDGVGEWATTSAWLGDGGRIRPLWQISFPHSLGLLYSAITSYCGFNDNLGEYKLMGLAPYGRPIYANNIRKNLIDIKPDGTFRLHLSYFKYHRGFRMTSPKLHRLFCQPLRKSESHISQFHMDIPASVQVVLEEIVRKLAKALQEETGIHQLCLSGGVALNCVENGKLLNIGIFQEIWIQPASGDSGSALAAALVAWHQYVHQLRTLLAPVSMKGGYLGPRFSNDEIRDSLAEIQSPHRYLDDSPLFAEVAALLDAGKVIGWFSGPMEFGPRALGSRFLIADPRNAGMQRTVNEKIKYRESF